MFSETKGLTELKKIKTVFRSKLGVFIWILSKIGNVIIHPAGHKVSSIIVSYYDNESSFNSLHKR
jgi:hypothetical protein